MDIITIIDRPATSLKKKIQQQGMPYLVCGGINTLFGYFGSVGLYTLLKHNLSTLAIIVIAKIMTISFSYFTYKIFIFKTKGNWIREYLRCYASYGFTSILTMAILLVLVDYAGVPFWLSQLFTLCIGAVVSFIAHSYYTFSQTD